MAVTIREQPHPLDFAGNGTRFLLKGTPILTAGSKSRSVWRVDALPSSVLTVGFGGTVLDFQISTPYQAMVKLRPASLSIFAALMSPSAFFLRSRRAVVTILRVCPASP